MFFNQFLKAQNRYAPEGRKSSSTVKHRVITENPDENLEDILKSLGNPDDLFIYRIGQGQEQGDETAAVVLYFESMIDGNLLGQHVIEPVNRLVQSKTETLSAEQLKRGISAPKVVEINDIHRAVDRLLVGEALILMAGVKNILALSLPGVPRRAVEEPPTEKSLKG